MSECYFEGRVSVEPTVDTAPPAQVDEAVPPVGGRHLALAVIASLVAHGLFGAIVQIARAADDDAAEITFVDIELAPAAPTAEELGPEQLEPKVATVAPGDIVAPSTEPAQPPPPVLDGVGPDAGVPEPDAAPGIAQLLDAGVPEVPPPSGDAGAMTEQPVVATGDRDAGAEVPSTTMSDGGVTDDPDGKQPASAATAANLLAYFPAKHMVSALLRFDRLRGTEWSPIMQKVLSAMPDYRTLIADPDTVVADRFDLVAMSSARPKDSGATILAVKSSMTPVDLRDFLDEPGAPVTWSRVTGGILGTRGAGDRVAKGDQRVFLTSFSSWTVLARPKDLKGALDAATGDLDAAMPDPKLLPVWMQHLPDLEAESGVPDGPAVMLTLTPKSKRWDIPEVGLGVESIPAPERLTLTAELDPQGFVIRGNLKLASVEDAEELVKSLEAAQQAALDSQLLSTILKRASAYNAVKGLSLVRTDQRVAYATSISIADARVLFTAGAEMVVEYFASLSAPDDSP